MPFTPLYLQPYPRALLCLHLPLELLQRSVVLGPPVELFRIWDVLLQLWALIQKATQRELLQRILRKREFSSPNPVPPPVLPSPPLHISHMPSPSGAAWVSWLQPIRDPGASVLGEGRSGGQARSSQTPCPIRRLLEPSRPGTKGFGLVVPRRKPLTFMFLGHQDPCLLVSFLLWGILMTPEYESHHVGNNVGTHEHRTAEGPAFNY